MTATSTLMGPDAPKYVIDLISNAIEEGNKRAAHMLWDGLQTFLAAHWQLFLGGLFILFIIFTLKAMIGQWGSLGSLLYNFFYFGTLYVIGLIWGPEIFISDYFNAACAVILYPVCYWLVGYILNKIGLKRNNRFK